MSSDTIENNVTSEPGTSKARCKLAKNGTAAKKASPSQAKKGASKPRAERSNKRAEALAMMKRAKGATLAEMMAETKWQAHTVRGLVSILGSKGGEKIESSKDAVGERTYKIAKVARTKFFSQTALPVSARGRHFLFV